MNKMQCRKDCSLSFLSFLALLVSLCLTHVNAATWEHYGKWYESSSMMMDEYYAEINKAKAAAIAEKRPLIVLFSKPGMDSCKICANHWKNGLCDGGEHCFGSYCNVAASGHPIVEWAREHKMIMLYVNGNVQSELISRMMVGGGQYSSFLSAPGNFPTVFIFHVKDTADCTTNNSTVLDTKNMDCLAAFWYAFTGTLTDASGYNVAPGVILSNNPTPQQFFNIVEAVLKNKYNTYGLTYDPAPAEDDDYKNAVKLSLGTDHTIVATGNIAMAKGVAGSWFTFSAVKNKRYWFNYEKVSGTNNSFTYEVFQKTSDGKPGSTAVTKGTAKVDEDFYWDNKSVSGDVYLKLTRSATTATYTYGLLARRGSVTAGENLAYPVSSVSLGKWTNGVVSSGSQRVVVTVSDFWSDDAMKLERYVASSTFKSFFGKAFWLVTDAVTESISYVNERGEIVAYEDDMDQLDSFTEKAWPILPVTENAITTQTLDGIKETCFKFNATAGKRYVFQLSGKTPSSATVNYAVYTSEDGGMSDMPAVEGVMAAGLANAFDAEETGPCFLKLTSNTAVTATLQAYCGSNASGSFLNPSSSVRKAYWASPKNPITGKAHVEASVVYWSKEWEALGSYVASEDFRNAFAGVYWSVAESKNGTTSLSYVNSDDETDLKISDAELFDEAKLAEFTNYFSLKVSFKSAVRPMLLTAGSVELPLVLSGNTDSLDEKGFTVKAKLTKPAGVRAEDFYPDEVTWKKGDTGEKCVKLDLSGMKYASAWNHLAFTVSIDKSSLPANVVTGAIPEMTVDVYNGRQDKPLILEDSSVEVGLATDTQDPASRKSGTVVHIACSKNYNMSMAASGLYYEVVEGTKPDDITVTLGAPDKTSGIYEVSFSSRTGSSGFGKGSFTLKLYEVVSGRQIQSTGSTVTINYTEKSVTDINPYGANGTKFGGSLFELNDGTRSEYDETHDVNGTVAMEVVQGRLEGTVRTSDGEIALTSAGWNAEASTGVLSATLTGMSDTGKHYSLTAKIDREGKSLVDGCMVTIDNKEAMLVEFQALPAAWTQEMLDNFCETYTAAFIQVKDRTSQTEVDNGACGGLIFNLKDDGTVNYKGFLPKSNATFEGTAVLRYNNDVEFVGTTGEFTVYEKLADSKESIGCIVTVESIKSHGSAEVCVDCSATHATWYRTSTNRLYYRVKGNCFNPSLTLTQQLPLSEEGEMVNSYYLMVDPPPKLAKGGALLAPRGTVVYEGLEGFGSGDSLFGVALAHDIVEGDVVRQGAGTDGSIALREGTFSGTIELYSKDYKSTNYTRTVAVKGVMVGAICTCCSITPLPVGYGFMELDGTSYPVKLYWTALEYTEQELPAKMDSLAVNTVNGQTWDGEAAATLINGVDGIDVTLAAKTDVLAIDNNGTVKIVSSNKLSLSGGSRWELYQVDLSGSADRRSESEAVRLDGCATKLVRLIPGWNLIAMPWNLQALAWDSTELLSCLYTVDNQGYTVRANGIVPGGAYWFYADQSDAGKSLACTLYDDETVAVPAVYGMSGDWWFGTDPGSSIRSSGWIWNGQDYEWTANKADTKAGGWWLLK